MTQPSLWDQGLWDEARWSYVTVEGTITEGPDGALGGIALIDPVGGLITEAPDVAVGGIFVSQGVSGNITEGHDQTSGTVSVINFVAANVTEKQDGAVGQIGIKVGVSGAVHDADDDVFGFIERGPNPVFGQIIEGKDQVSNASTVTVGVSGAIKEHRDKVRGNLFGISGYKRPGGGWAPQFYYEREWEKKPEPVIEEVIDLSLEPDPYFIPQALPMDPAVARILETIMQGPQVIDTDEEDIEAILMNL